MWGNSGEALIVTRGACGAKSFALGVFMFSSLLFTPTPVSSAQPDILPVEITGYWITDLGKVRIAAPVGDGANLWAIGPDGRGFTLIDARQGTLVEGLALGNEEIDRIVPIPGTSDAWVSTGSGLYLAGAKTLSVSSHPLLPGKIGDILPGLNGDLTWVINYAVPVTSSTSDRNLQGTLHVLQRSGSDMIARFVTNGIRNITQGADVDSVWVWSFGSPLLRRLKWTGSSADQASLVLPSAILEVVSTQNRSQAWVNLSNGPELKDGGFQYGLAYLVNIDNQRTVPLMSSPLETLVPSSDGQLVWASPPAGKGLFAARMTGFPAVETKSLLVSEQVSGIRPVAGAHKAWVELNLVYSKGIAFVDLSHDVTEDKLLSGISIYKTATQLRGRYLWAAPSEQGSWEVRTDVPGGEGTTKGVYLIDDAGALAAGGQKLLPSVGVHDIKAQFDPDYAWILSAKREGIYLLRTDGSIVNGDQAMLKFVHPDANDPRLSVLRAGGHDVLTLTEVDYGFNRPSVVRFQHSYWFGSASRGNGQDILKASVEIGSAQLDLHTEVGARLATGVLNDPVSVKFSILLRGQHPSQRTNVEIRNKKTNELIASGNTSGTASGWISLSYPGSQRLVWNEPCSVILRVQDDLGTQMAISWPNVELVMPWWKRPLIVTILVWSIITLAFVALLFLPPQFPARKWLPLTPYVLGGSLNIPVFTDYFSGDKTLLIWLLASDVFLFAAIGLLSPNAARRLAQAAIFQSVFCFAMLFHPIRRRLYIDYIAQVRRELSFLREKANFETYVPIRVTVDTNVPYQGTQPDLVLRSLLNGSADQEGANVLVEAPGGRGKSALLRQVTERQLEAFENGEDVPLPVLCSGKSDSIENAVRKSLGRYLASNELLSFHLESGHFLVVFDAIAEAGLDPELVKVFLLGAYGEQTRILLSSRPDGHFKEAVRFSKHWAVVTPQSLDDATIEEFLRAYSEADSKRTGNTVRKLSREMQSVCRTPEGQYLPILVRLAMLAQTGGTPSIEGIYEWAIRQRLRATASAQPDDEIYLKKAISLCLKYAWENKETAGDRTFVVKGDDRETVDRLLQADILVSAQFGDTALGIPVRQVRFFHDSVQSFLIARGLVETEQYAGLHRAAGDPRFSRARSEVFLGAGSELFQMCLAVFSPDRLTTIMNRDLSEWAVQLARHLTYEDVFAAIPAEIRSQVVEAAGTGVDPRALLQAAVRLVGKVPSNLVPLASLYAAMAAKTWSILSSQPPREEPSNLAAE